MKTLLFRNTAWLLILSFCFTQVAPVAAAAPGVLFKEGESSRVPVRVPERGVLQKPAESPTSVPLGGYERFVTKGPLEPVLRRTPEELAAMAAAKVANESTSSNFTEDTSSKPIVRKEPDPNLTESGRPIVRASAILPKEVFQAAQVNLSPAELDQLNRAMRDFGPNSQFSLQVGLNGQGRTWNWTSADGKTKYSLVESVISIQNPDGTLHVDTQWSFSAEMPATADELRALASGLSADQRAGFLRAIDAAVAAGSKFLKEVSGGAVSYRWNMAGELERIYSIDVGPGGELSFSSQLNIAELESKGWKHVPSMTNTVYQVISGNKVRVMDLLTGVVSDKPSSQKKMNGLPALL